MVRIEDTVWCEGCGVEIRWPPVSMKGHHYCCTDCAAGRACECVSLLDAEDERRAESTAQDAVMASFDQ